MNKFRWNALPKQITDAWPVFAAAAILIAYVAARWFFPDHAQSISKIVVTICASAGGVLILVGEYLKLKAFAKLAPDEMVKNWFKAFTVQTHESTGTLEAGSAKFSGRTFRVESNDKSALFAVEMKSMHDEISAVHHDMNHRFEVTAMEFPKMFNKIREIAVGGFKTQVFGGLLAVIGGIANFYP